MNHAVQWLERDYDNWEWEEWEAQDRDGWFRYFVWRPKGPLPQPSVSIPRPMLDVIDQTEGWADPADTEDEDLEYTLDWGDPAS